MTEEILHYVKSATAVEEKEDIFYPGERTLQKRAENKEKGIPVEEAIWEKIKEL